MKIGVVAMSFCILFMVMGACATPTKPCSRCQPKTLVYVAATGSDTATGDATHPLCTLAGAQTRLISLDRCCDAIVRIAPDTFLNERVTWTFYVPGHTTTFTSWPPESKALFKSQGVSSDSAFFTFKASASDSTRLVFHGLHVRGYTAGAIWFVGNWPEANGWNSGNIIEDCIFDSIGNAWHPDRPICYGVLDFVGSRGNTIRRCRFEDCSNNTDGIIAIYLAHGSSANQVYADTFWVVNGWAVRMRDASNDNRVHDSIFEKVGTSRVSTWFCLPSEETCYALECPALNNLVYDNQMWGSYGCGYGFDVSDMQPAPAQPGCLDGTRITGYNNLVDTCHYHYMERDTGGIE